MVARDQWVLWGKLSGRKVPLNPATLMMAKSNEPKTWSSYSKAVDAARKYRLGLGFVFTPSDGMFGIDLDSCYSHPHLQKWAGSILEKIDSYSEISPSKTGVKIIGQGSIPDGVGRILQLGMSNGKKSSAIEVYDRGRYFAITGCRIGQRKEPEMRQEQLEELIEMIDSFNGPKAFMQPPRPLQRAMNSDRIYERARRYVEVARPAISGSGGHHATRSMAMVLVGGFGLQKNMAVDLMLEWNAKCCPPWSYEQILNFVSSADAKAIHKGWKI
jgi:hypothetical protein